MTELKESVRKLLLEIEETRGEVKEEPILITRFGRKAEQLFLGFTIPDDANLYFGPEEYLEFKAALEEMKGIQPGGYDPSNPLEGCNEEFFRAVKSFIKSGADGLQYFISVGTKFDFWHGVDAVFSWRGVIATIDVTVDPEKIQKFRRRESLRECLPLDNSGQEEILKELQTLEKEVKADFCIMIPNDLESGEVYTSIARGIALLLIKRHLNKYN